MNRLYTIFLTLLTAIFLTGCYNSEDREKVLKIYNWGDYIDEEVLAAFPEWYKEQTGEEISIVYQTFDINEIMLTKIERGKEDFDVVCPSEYIIERMLVKDLLLPIDTAFGKTPNYIHNISPARHQTTFTIYLHMYVASWISLDFLDARRRNMQ